MKNLLPYFILCLSTTSFAQQADSSRYYFQLAMGEKTAGRNLIASNYFDRSIQYDTNYLDAYIQLGNTQLEMKRTDQAKANFEKAYILDASNKSTIRALMELYFNYHQYAKAIEFARKCSECDNVDRILGLCYYQQEDYTKAEYHLLRALQKDPNNAEVTYTIGRNYLDMEEYVKAVPYYSKAIQLDETRNVWMYELGLLYYNLNDYKNAKLLFENAEGHGYIRSNDFLENIGYASLYTGEYDKGENLLLDIWKRKPGNKDILRDLAEILYQQKQYDRSLTYCQKLMEIDAKDGKALYQAGLCFQKKGQKERGQQMCDKAIEMDPTLENLRRKKEMIGL